MLLLFCVFVALAFAQTTVTRVQLNPGGGPLLLTTPWTTSYTKETTGQHFYSDLPTDFYSLPHRYGFRVSGLWNVYRPVDAALVAPPAFFPNYEPPTTAWLRLCDAVPATNDDFTVVIQAFGEVPTSETCFSKCISPTFNWTIEALQADGVSTKTVARPSIVTDADGFCTDNRMVVNIGALRKANPGSSLFIKLVNTFGVYKPVPDPDPQSCVNPTRACPTNNPVCYRGSPIPAVAGGAAAVATGQCLTRGSTVRVDEVDYTVCARHEDCGGSTPICAPAPASVPGLAGTTICVACMSNADCFARARVLGSPPGTQPQNNLVCSRVTGTLGECLSTNTRLHSFEFRFQRPGTTWTDIKSCTYTTPSNLVLAECKAISADFVTCANGVYEPANEECDIGLDSVGCTPSCRCLQPRVPDGTGKCSFCGNGAVEQLQGEKCDRGTDAGCASDCKSCLTGFALNAANKCTKCGNGVSESGEVCDFAIDPLRCSQSCTCPTGYVGNGRGGCTMCGNGVLDLGEVCDNKFPNCNTECTGCATPYVARSALVDSTGACTLCGNGVLDAGEKCDWKNDYNCFPDCSGCTAFHNIVNGMCSRCGNGYLDAGEKCDSLRDNCARDCQSCVNGRTPANDKWGNCGGCGNGVVDPDEVCDTGIDGAKCAPDCGSCQHPYTSVGRRCVTCGNGRLDTVRDADGTILFVEVCDAAQPGCRDDCSACESGWDQSGDAAGTCVPQCDACCEALAERTGATDDEVASASTMAVSFAFFGLLATLL